MNKKGTCNNLLNYWPPSLLKSQKSQESKTGATLQVRSTAPLRYAHSFLYGGMGSDDISRDLLEVDMGALSIHMHSSSLYSVP